MTNGEVVVRTEELMQTVPCPYCEGTGLNPFSTSPKSDCTGCRGIGRVQKNLAGGMKKILAEAAGSIINVRALEKLRHRGLL
jgi:hypothetical protein